MQDMQAEVRTRYSDVWLLRWGGEGRLRSSGKGEEGAGRGVRVCDHCGDVAASRKNLWCARCKEVCYCGRECQRAAWPEHKPTCVVLLRDREQRDEQRQQMGGEHTAQERALQQIYCAPDLGSGLIWCGMTDIEEGGGAKTDADAVKEELRTTATTATSENKSKNKKKKKKKKSSKRGGNGKKR